MPPNNLLQTDLECIKSKEQEKNSLGKLKWKESECGTRQASSVPAPNRDKLFEMNSRETACACAHYSSGN